MRIKDILNKMTTDYWIALIAGIFLIALLLMLTYSTYIK